MFLNSADTGTFKEQLECGVPCLNSQCQIERHMKGEYNERVVTGMGPLGKIYRQKGVFHREPEAEHGSSTYISYGLC